MELGAVKGASGLGAEGGRRSPIVQGAARGVREAVAWARGFAPLALPVLELGIISPYCTLPTWKD